MESQRVGIQVGRPRFRRWAYCIVDSFGNSSFHISRWRTGRNRKRGQRPRVRVDLGPPPGKELINFRPHNVSLVNLGTFILFFGWLGFNGGSAFGANLRAIMAIWNSMVSAAFGGLTWCLMDYRIERRWSMVGFCSGTIAGLVAATPSSGYIHPWAALVVGVVSAAICNLATKGRYPQLGLSSLNSWLIIPLVKFLLRIDDALDLFAEHAVGGMVGLILAAFSEIRKW